MPLDPTMVTMLQKTRALSEDMLQHSVEVFSYTNSNIWTLAEPHIHEITQVLLNGNILQSGEVYTWNPISNKITITGHDFLSTDILEVNYSFTKYSDTEIIEYIRSAFVWLSIYDSGIITFSISDIGVITPFPELKTLDLICIIASILIKPYYVSYKTSSLSINYPNTMTQEEKITEIINRYKHGIGVVSIIEYDSNHWL